MSTSAKNNHHYLYYKGEYYLTLGEVMAYTGNKSNQWLATRRKRGYLTTYHLEGNMRTPYFKLTDVQALNIPVPDSRTMQKREQDSDFLTIPDIARKLRVSESYIYKLRHEGKLHAINIGTSGPGAVWRVPKSEYERFVAERLGSGEHVGV